MSNFYVHSHKNSHYPISDWSGVNDHDRVQRQLSVSSDSKLLDEDIREETRVIMRPKKPPRPKSEVFLNKQDLHPRRKRFSAFGVSTDNEYYINWLSFISSVVTHYNGSGGGSFFFLLCVFSHSANMMGGCA